MGARQRIEKNKNAATAASAVVVLCAIGFMAYTLRGDRPPTKDWYTVDDGQTWFKDSNRKVPPFEHDGKEAVFAKVYECHGQKFVAYMKRFKPDGKRRMDEARAAEDAGQALDQTKLAGVEFQLEYKRPGDKEWTSALDKIAKMMDVKCPHGTNEDPLIVYP